MKRRLAGEWEPIKGVMLAWPPFLPHKYIVDLTQNYSVYMCVPNKEEIEIAKYYLSKWGGNLKNLIFCIAPQGFDTPWVRDWGMHPIFDENGKLFLAGAEYKMSTPFVSINKPEIMFDCEHNLLTTNSYEQKEDQSQELIAKQIGLPFMKLPYALTGGNLMSDSFNKLMSMHILQTENRAKGISDEEFFSMVARDTGMNEYYIFSNFADYGLQHIDCYLKIIDEETLLVSRTPKEHYLYERYEKILEEVKKVETRYGRPFKIFRIDIVPFQKDSDELTAYVNSVILNSRVYVPMYGIEQDKIAIKQWQNALPGYEIKGYEFDFEKEPDIIKNRTGYVRTGWGNEDVIHCRTRAIWDENMLYISVKRLEEIVSENDALEVTIQIVDYSKAGLDYENCRLFYRYYGFQTWESIMLEETTEAEIFFANMIGKSGDMIEYFVQAKSCSGMCETMPPVAPKGTYKVTIK